MLKSGFLQDVAKNVPAMSELLTPLSLFLANDTDPFQATRLLLCNLRQSTLYKMTQMLRDWVPLADEKSRESQMLDWDMLQDWVAGGMTVGSHSKSHVLLTNETPETVWEELQGSRLELEQRLSTPIRHFAYPDGNYDGSTASAVAAAGYSAAYTVCSHRDPHHPMLSVPRRLLWENSCTGAFGHFSPAIFSCQVNGVFDYVNRCGLQH